ncbi:MAG: 1-deoxy-D-xylulose-5-phosphate reductoisomerase [Muribaculaceae bacterium]
MKNIAVLGSTGSIGTQTLDIISRHSHRYRASVLVAGSRVDDLIEQARRHKPDLAIIAREDLYERLSSALAPLGIETAAGSKAIADAVTGSNVDTVVTATVGYSGLEPTVAAIKAGKDIALANKETMVVAGSYITRLLAASPSKVYPVDSEHSAIYQCLQGEDPATVKRLIITASGGPFRTWSEEKIRTARAADALKHPNWDMGAKITIDSATMVNKAFEIIEARWLFGIDPDKISAVVHPQSIIHSMVEFQDGAIKAQMGVPEMTLPIAYALGEASRSSNVADFCDLIATGSLTFEQPDTTRFPSLRLAHIAMERGGNAACTINAANEIAVAAFLRDDIAFNDIYNTITATLERTPFIADATYDDFVATNAEARAIARSLIYK